MNQPVGTDAKESSIYTTSYSGKNALREMFPQAPGNNQQLFDSEKEEQAHKADMQRSNATVTGSQLSHSINLSSI